LFLNFDHVMVALFLMIFSILVVAYDIYSIAILVSSTPIFSLYQYHYFR
jgi:hypothetical protein